VCYSDLMVDELLEAHGDTLPEGVRVSRARTTR
jgi:hypothetical protein